MATESFEVIVWETPYGRKDASINLDMTGQGWTALTHPKRVEFELVDEETLILNKIKALDESINKIREEASEKMSYLEEQKQILLALTHQNELQEQ